jgi:hypothetical protein
MPGGLGWRASLRWQAGSFAAFKKVNFYFIKHSKLGTI